MAVLDEESINVVNPVASVLLNVSEVFKDIAQQQRDDPDLVKMSTI